MSLVLSVAVLVGVAVGDAHAAVNDDDALEELATEGVLEIEESLENFNCASDEDGDTNTEVGESVARESTDAVEGSVVGDVYADPDEVPLVLPGKVSEVKRERGS